MQITIHATASNTKTIPDLLAEGGYILPCNCHGTHRCNGAVYPFDCSLVPIEPITITLPDSIAQTTTQSQNDIYGISLENQTPTTGTADTVLIDLGTTTIALALMDHTTASLQCTSVFANPQRTYGSDVIARIQASLQGKKLTMKKEIIHALTEQVEALCTKNKQSLLPTHCIIGGNTTMIHLLMGYDCAPLAASPFALKETSPAPFQYSSCQIYIFPWLSAFVGGDITAGMYACHMETFFLDDGSGPKLLIDLGTNGEMVLCHNGHCYTAATAAGPAFEGNGLSCGCPAIPGAISNIRLRKLRPSITTIGNKIPIGICGSGAIALCAELLHHGYMTKEGILTRHFPSDGIFLGHTPSHTPLYFTADDLRQVQLSVAAIAAGVDTLTHAAGITPEDIVSVYLGGGFGFYLNPDAYQELRLFSSIPASQIHPMGNTCLNGLFRYACAMDTEPLPILPSTHPIRLAEDPYFRQQFINHMTYSG